jgi:hypothetical protein
VAANGFSPSASIQVVATGSAQTIANPGSGATLRLANVGAEPVYVALSASSPVVVTPQTGLAILPGAPPEFLTAVSSGFIGFVTDGNTFNVRLNISQGT